MQDDEIFEWDGAKAASNAKKHGISFEQARAIWDDPLCLIVKTAYPLEDRWVAIGRVAPSRYLSAVITYRGDDPERIRIISARESTKQEIGAYHAL